MNENQIDRYLLDLLSPEEKQAFESKVDQDESLAKELDQQRELVQDIEGMGRLELKSKLQGIHSTLEFDKNKPQTKIRTLISRIAVAAVSLSILTAGWWYLQQSPSHTELFAQNFEPYELSLNQRSEGENTLKDIENLYIDGQYAQAIPLFQTALNNGPRKSSQMLLGLGISYLQTNQYEEAITQFNAILANNDFNFEDEAEWYLGLTYLKKEDFNNARLHLDNLAADPKRDHHNSAKLLVAQLPQ